MKKNKTIAYMMAAMLLVGGTFVGTKALFTDKVDTVGELSISTGDVDLGQYVSKDWTLDRNGEDSNTGSTSKVAKFDNLKYGDVLTKEVKIINKGTLKAVVNFEENTDVTSKLPKGIKYEATFKNDNGEEIEKGSVMEPNATGTVEFKLEVIEGGKHNDNESLNSDAQEKQIIELNNSYTLDAEQITKDTKLN